MKETKCKQGYALFCKSLKILTETNTKFYFDGVEWKICLTMLTPEHQRELREHTNHLQFKGKETFQVNPGVNLIKLFWHKFTYSIL